MSSRVPTNVRFSLDEFARHGGASAPHRDGWGIAFYEGTDVRLLREARPASDSALVRFLEEHDLPSSLVVSHIRRATRGERVLKNTHPFQRELGGRVHVFAHNGELPGIEDHPNLKAGSRQPVGQTYSELSFCALLRRLEPLWATGSPPLPARLEIVSSFADDLRGLGPANFLYSDGEFLFIHSHQRRHVEGGPFEPPGMHILKRTCPCRVLHDAWGVKLGECGEPQRVVLVASVPLSDEAWEPVPEGTILVAAGGEVVAESAP